MATAVPPNVVIEEVSDEEQPEGPSVRHETVLDETAPSTVRTRRASWLQKRRSSSSHVEESSQDSSSGQAFAKLVKTVQFIKRWAGRAERQPDGREEFLERFKMAVPNIDDAYTAPADGEAGQADGTIQVSTKKKKKWKKILLLNPTGSWLYRWLAVITVAVLYNSFLIIVRETFDQLQEQYLPLWLVLDYTADMIYILDMVVHFFTSYLEQGLFVTKMKKLALHYIKSRLFLLDVLSLLPFDLLYAIPAVGSGKVIVRLNRMFRIHRMILFFDRTESRTNYPNLFRVFTLVLYITLIIHWNACFYFLISQSIGFGSDSWVYPAMEDSHGNNTEYASLSRQYLVSFYWSTLTLTTIGELPGPVTDSEYAFVILDFLIGVLIFATIVGMVGGIITNMNVRRTEFNSRLDNIKQYMRYRNVGKDLQGRVIKWFDYLWTNNHSLDEQEILQSLPDKLKAEIAIHVHFETLRRVAIFEECEAGLLEELVLKLKPQVYSPGDFVCRKGDIGKEMYIIKHGRLEVVGDDGHTVLAVLTDGGYFGEISVLNLSGSGNRRTANVRSVGYSDLFCLSKNDLLEALTEYPEAKALLEERGRKTLMKDGTLEQSEVMALAQTSSKSPKRTGGAAKGAPLSDVNDIKQRQETLEANLEQLQGRFTRLLGEYNTAQMKLKQRIYALETRSKMAAA